MKKGIEWFIFIWFVFVYVSYAYFHRNYLLFVAIPMVCFAFLLLRRRIIKIPEIDIRLPLLHIGWLCIFILFLWSNLFVFQRIFLFDGMNIVDNVSLFIKINSIIAGRVFFITAFILFSLSCGRRILKKLRLLPKEFTCEILFSFGAGTVFLVLVSFLMAILGALQFLPSLAVISVIALWSVQEIGYFLSTAKKRTLRIHLFFPSQIHRSFILKAGVLAVVIVVFFSFFLILYQAPLDYDDLDTYFSVPLLYAQNGKVVTFPNSPSAVAGGFGLFLYGLIYVLVHPLFAKTLPWIFFVFLLVTVWYFTRRMFSRDIAQMTLFFSAFAPWNISFLSTNKVIFQFAFYSALAVLGFFLWFENRKMKWLILSSLFLGFCILIKLNGLLLGGMFVIGMLLLLARKQCMFRQAVFFGLIALLAASPLFVFNVIYYRNPIAPFPLAFFSKPTDALFQHTEPVTMLDIYSQGHLFQKYSRENTQLTRWTKISQSSVVNFFWILWNITVNQKGFNFLYSEIGPFLLIFIPFFILFFILHPSSFHRRLFLLLLFSTIFFFLWYWKGSFRPWYGVSLFYFLFIFVSFVVMQLKIRLIFTACMILIFSFAAGVILTSLLHIMLLLHPFNAPFLSYDDFIGKNSPVDLFRFYHRVNEGFLNKNTSAKILMIPESRTAFLHRWNESIIADHWMIYWRSILNASDNFEDVRRILKEQGITYILFSYQNYSWLKSFDHGDDTAHSLFSAADAFFDFRDAFLQEAACFEDLFCLYQLR